MSGSWYRNYSTYYKAEPSRIRAIDELISLLQSHENLSYHGAIRRVFDAGLECLMKEIAYASPKLEESAEIARLFRIAKGRADRKKEFETIYKELGPHVIQKIARETGVNFDELLDAYRLPLSAPNRSEVMSRWISEYMADGKMHLAPQIIEAAIVDGVLMDPEIDPIRHEKDVSIFRKVASKRGYSSGTRDEWQRV